MAAKKSKAKAAKVLKNKKNIRTPKTTNEPEVEGHGMVKAPPAAGANKGAVKGAVKGAIK